MKGWIVAIALAACGGSNAYVQARPYVGPDGTYAWFIECRDDPGACWIQAGLACPAGYDVVGSDRSLDSESSGSAVATGHFAGARAQTHTVINSELRVHCRGATAAAPAAPPAARTSGPNDPCLKSPLMRTNMELGVDCPNDRAGTYGDVRAPPAAH